MKEILFVVFLYTMGVIAILIPTKGSIEYFIMKIIIGVLLLLFIVAFGFYIIDLIEDRRK